MAVTRWLHTDGAETSIPGSLASGVTTAVVQASSVFPVPGANDQFAALIEDAGQPTYNPLTDNWEVVLVTGNNTGSNTLTFAVATTKSYLAGARISQIVSSSELVEGGAYLRADSRAFLRVHHAAATGITNATNTLLPFDTVDEDPSAAWSATNHLWTVPVAGRYLIKLQVKMNPAGGGGVTVCGIYVNANSGTPQHGGIPASLNSTKSTGTSIIKTLRLAAGDTVGARIYVDTGGGVQIDPAELGTHMEIDRIGN